MARDNAEALNRFLDDLSHGPSVSEDDVDPDLIATVRWFGDLGAEPRPEPDFRNRLEHDLMNQLALAPVTGLPTTGPTHVLPTGSRHRWMSPLAHLPWQRPRLQWVSAALATAVLLTVLTLAYLALGPLRPNPERPHQGPAANVPEPSATPVTIAATGHPVAGAWQWTFVDGESFGIFDPDGTYVEYFPDNGIGIGGWRPTGERSAELVVVYQIPSEPLAREELFAPDYAATGHSFQPGALVQRLTIQVDESGTSLIATGTSERRDPSGNVVSSVEIEPQGATRVAGDDVPPAETGDQGFVVVEVRDESDQTTPIAGACVQFNGPVTVHVCDDGIGDADPTPGRIEVPALPAGEYLIEASPPEGYQPWQKPNALTVHPGEAGTLTIFLRPTGGGTSPPPTMVPPGSSTAGGLIVQVVAEDGVSPIGGACLEVAGPSTVWVCDDALGDVDPNPGMIELDGLPEGNYAVSVLPPEGFVPSGEWGTLVVLPGQISSLSITLHPTGSVVVEPTVAVPPGSTGPGSIVIIRVVAEDGVTSIGGTCVAVTGDFTVHVCDDSVDDLDPTPGSIELDGLPGGSYIIAVVAPPAGYEPPAETALDITPADASIVTVVLREIVEPTPTIPPRPMPTVTPAT